MTAPGRAVHVSRSAPLQAGIRAVARGRLREAEVQDLDDAIRRDLDVRWLEIAMDDPLLVGGIECAAI